MRIFGSGCKQFNITIIRLQTGQDRNIMDVHGVALAGNCFGKCKSGDLCIWWSVHPAALALFLFSFSSQRHQLIVQSGMLHPTKNQHGGCCSLLKGPSLPQATLSTSATQVVVSFPCGGRFWSWPKFSPLCRCNFLRCSIGPLWG